MVAASKPRRSLRPRLVRVHRWLGLGAAAFWLVQALTGMLIMFHWELRDASIATFHRPTDLAAIERRIEALAPPATARSVGSVWTTAGLPDRYDIFFTDARGVARSARVAGDGTILRGPTEGADDIFGTLVGIHHDLLAGETGEWIVGISGILLLTNLAAGLTMAWPRRGAWRGALRPLAKGPAPVRLYSWHRALGLWLAVPAILLVATGTMLRFATGIGEMAGVEQPSLPSIPPSDDQPIGFATAAQAALGAIPGSTLTAVTFPTGGDATYQILVRAPDEIRRAYGASLVFVDANNGRVRGAYPIAEADGRRAFMSVLFPIHTGEVGGLAGRLVALTLGAWLATMVGLGVLLWLRRRPRRRTT
jgi:uncharacterized iron-regulated membrane protein